MNAVNPRECRQCNSVESGDNNCSTNITIFYNMSEKCPSSIQCGGSNPQPLGRESPPVTTSKRLPKHWAYLRESNIFVKNWFGKKRGRFWLKSRTCFTNYFGKNFREFRAQLFLQLTSKVLFFLFFPVQYFFGSSPLSVTRLGNFCKLSR